MTEDEIAARAIATVLFEMFLLIGGAIATILPSKPIATMISSILLIIAGVLQINHIAEFSLVFTGTIFLLILSWVAVISIAFGVLILAFSIIAMIRTTTKKQKYTRKSPSANPSEALSNEIKKYKALLDDGLITQEEYDEKKKQLLGL